MELSNHMTGIIIEDMQMTFLYYLSYTIIFLNLGVTKNLNMKFSFEEKKDGKFPFLDVEVSQEGNKFATTVHRKQIFSGVYTQFDSFFYLLHTHLA